MNFIAKDVDGTELQSGDYVKCLADIQQFYNEPTPGWVTRIAMGDIVMVCTIVCDDGFMPEKTIVVNSKLFKKVGNHQFDTKEELRRN